MLFFPTNGLIYVNKDISSSVEEHLVRQLKIDRVISEEEDGYGNWEYEGGRVMVKKEFWGRGDFPELWEKCDAAIYVRNGLVAIERCKFGAPGLTCKILNVTWSFLIGK